MLFTFFAAAEVSRRHVRHIESFCQLDSVLCVYLSFFMDKRGTISLVIKVLENLLVHIQPMQV